MKLYEIPRTMKGTWVRVLEAVDGPPGALGIKAGALVLYYGIDGSYSQCKSRGGELIYLKAWAEVEVVKDE